MNNTNNPHLKVLPRNNKDSFIINNINKYMKDNNKTNINLLDIGGGKGYGKILYNKDYINYYALDLNSSHKEDKITFIKGDITTKDLNLNIKFDIIFTKDTFEHILNPWDATQNILNHLLNKGLFIFLAPFSWRYHASPYDTFRYTHTGAQYMFERLGGLKKLSSGYIGFGSTNGFWKNKKDHTFNGKPYPNCIDVIYIGKRDITYKFNKSVLDSDFSWDHAS